MLDYIRELDHQLLIFINQLGNTGWDSFWLTITNAWNWIPFFLLILFVVFKKFSRREVKWILFYVGLTFFFTALMTFGTKELVQRLRPLHNEELMPYLRIITTEKGYSFFSGHTSNSFALTTFLYLVFRKRMKVAFWLFLWPIPYAYSRLYLGVHFPTDILVGLLVGITTAHIGYWLYRKNEQRLISKDSPQYTPQPLQK